MGKALVINGSPRKDGITMELARVVIKTIEETGYEVEILHLVDCDIRPCKGCGSEDPKKCTRRTCTSDDLRDDMVWIFEKILEADILIFVTPVYWYAMSGMMKNLIDRLTALENEGKLLDGKVGAIVVTGTEDGAMQTILGLMGTLNDMGVLFPPYGFTYSIGFEDITKDREAIHYATLVGKNVVKLCELTKGERWWVDFNP